VMMMMIIWGYIILILSMARYVSPCLKLLARCRRAWSNQAQAGQVTTWARGTLARAGAKRGYVVSFFKCLKDSYYWKKSVQVWPEWFDESFYLFYLHIYLGTYYIPPTTTPSSPPTCHRIKPACWRVFACSLQYKVCEPKKKKVFLGTGAEHRETSVHI
jgi:hypothetical protein